MLKLVGANVVRNRSSVPKYFHTKHLLNYKEKKAILQWRLLEDIMLIK